MINYAKKNEFLLFRYLLTINESKFHPQMNEIGEGYNTIEELNNKKNAIFLKILKNFPLIPSKQENNLPVPSGKLRFYRKSDAHHPEQVILIAQASKQKEIIQNYEPIAMKHEPYSFIAVDTDPEIQIIAIAKHPELKSIIQKFTANLQKKQKWPQKIEHVIKVKIEL